MDNQIRRQTEKHSAKQSLGVLITSANGLVDARAPLDHEKQRWREVEEVEEVEEGRAVKVLCVYSTVAFVRR